MYFNLLPKGFYPLGITSLKCLCTSGILKIIDSNRIINNKLIIFLFMLGNFLLLHIVFKFEIENLDLKFENKIKQEIERKKKKKRRRTTCAWPRLLLPVPTQVCPKQTVRPAPSPPVTATSGPPVRPSVCARSSALCL
jgi:hypothetical protein